MKGTSKIIMVATLVMMVSLAIVLALVFVLLAHLYCSILIRRRRQHRMTAAAASAAAANSSDSQQHVHERVASPQNLRSFYAQGVLQAPRSILFPAIEDKSDTEKQNPPPKSPQNVGKVQHVVSINDLMYISNPIYDNDVAGGRSRGEAETPFETPDSSPSRLGTGECSSGDPSSPVSVVNTPPLTPMKKLPAAACSVSLRDGGSLVTSGSDEFNSNGGVFSSSSGSPCTSPSW